LELDDEEDKVGDLSGNSTRTEGAAAASVLRVNRARIA
jgi:hypothetical protein